MPLLNLEELLMRGFACSSKIFQDFYLFYGNWLLIHAPGLFLPLFLCEFYLFPFPRVSAQTPPFLYSRTPCMIHKQTTRPSPPPSPPPSFTVFILNNSLLK
ncbi:hypothetical protein L873DRAFT_1809113 [Choiromyces venosus 120613-1]|uniref:Uncharacterized protein n=1 Tax=Choiromyces venosus 120613-1 TaxID=1336337 RepID=A0A3N4JI83_9PEZI|nr:hypothetical protein L873DRAFT_1809113 [Choiromyces venosus 120613-1]